MGSPTNLEELIQKLTDLLSAPKVTPFYNEPIFLTLVSISFGGLLLTLISKNIEQRSKRRVMAIKFIEDVGSSLNEVLTSIASHRKRRIFGKNTKEDLDEKRGNLFGSIFSVKVKSVAFLGSDEFWKKYELIIFQIDYAIFYMKRIGEGDSEEICFRLREKKELLKKEWPISETVKMLDKFDDEVQKEFYEYEKMLWIRASSLISSSLSKVV